MIRRAVLNDTPAIKELMLSEPRFWNQEWRHDVIERVLNATGSLSFVWEEDSNIKGFICAHDLGFRAYLNELIVKEPKRNSGIGKRLIEHVEHILEEQGCTTIISDVWKKSVSFYKNLGWSEPDVVVLRKKLNPIVTT